MSLYRPDSETRVIDGAQPQICPPIILVEIMPLPPTIGGDTSSASRLRL